MRREEADAASAVGTRVVFTSTWVEDEMDEYTVTVQAGTLGEVVGGPLWGHGLAHLLVRLPGGLQDVAQWVPVDVLDVAP